MKGHPKDDLLHDVDVVVKLLPNICCTIHHSTNVHLPRNKYNDYLDWLRLNVQDDGGRHGYGE